MLLNLFRYALLGVLLANHAFAQDKIEPQLLQEELTILGNIAIETSPKLTEEKRALILDLIAQNKAKIEGKSMTAIEFLNFFSGIDIPTAFDEHASIEIEEAVLMPLLTGNKLFPLPIKILDDHVVVNDANGALPYGSIIHSINGQTTASILQTLSKKMDTFSKRRMERQFSIIYCIKHPSSETYTVTYSEPLSLEVKQEKQLSGTDLNGWVKKMRETSVYPLDKAGLNNLTNTRYYPEDKAYYFQLNSFNRDPQLDKGPFDKWRDDRKKFDRTFKTIFNEINEVNAEHLIIDLRYNGGGSIYIPALLYSYIAQKTFIEHDRLEIPDFSLPHEEYISELNEKPVEDENDIKRFIKKYESQFKEFENGYYWEAVKRHEVKPQKDAFQGNVHLLIGGNTCSASSYFTALFKGEKRGTIIGEEIGGSHHAITAGTTISYQLPHTRIKVKVPLMLVNFSDDLYEKVPELKVMPDVVLSQEAAYEYLLKKQDPELEATFDLIRKTNR